MFFDPLENLIRCESSTPPLDALMVQQGWTYGQSFGKEADWVEIWASFEGTSDLLTAHLLGWANKLGLLTVSEQVNEWGLTGEQENLMQILVLNFEGVCWFGEFRELSDLNDRILVEDLRHLEELGLLERVVLPKLEGLGKVLELMDTKARGFWERKGLAKLLKSDGRRPLYFSTEKGENQVCEYHDFLLES